MISRTVLRSVHLAGTPLIGAFVYSAALRDVPAFALCVQIVVFPLIALAGLSMWPGLRGLRRRLAGPTRA